MNFLKIVLLGVSMTFLSASYANAALKCDPTCKTGETCRYDSTKTPVHYCEKNKAVKSKGMTKKPSTTQGSSTSTPRN